MILYGYDKLYIYFQMVYNNFLILFFLNQLLVNISQTKKNMKTRCLAFER